ncbi:MAG: hypothetical protein ABI864_01195 [Chloroflexota bacterium]
MSTGYMARERSLFEQKSQRRALGPSLATALPQILTLIVIAGAIAFVVGRMPINGRGDYGQWLMTSRYYLGEGVPDYRTITALPPLIPFLLAALRVVVPDPGVALQTFNVVVLLSLVASTYLVASTVFADRLAGIFAVALAFLVTDRFLELFAFGGLLQAGALVFTLLSVAAFVRAGRDMDGSGRWWTLGSLTLALAALSHVGTGLMAVPVCSAVALISAVRVMRNTPRQRLLNRRSVVRAASGALAVPLAVLAYWLLVLLPASVEYVTNPASLNYRGADRLLKGLETYWPTMVLIGIGVGFLVLGVAGELRRRRFGPYALLCVWTATAWGSLLVSILGGASTDYPRFATPLMAPLVVAGAGGLLSVSQWLVGYLHSHVPAAPRVDWRLGVLAVVCLLAPLGFQRYANHVKFYQPLDAPGLTSVGVWLGQQLTGGESVVTPVREGKWIEGVTGHAAVFSQPVRYTFRPLERQRSLVAETIVKSTLALTSNDFFLKFSYGASDGREMVPRGLVVGANHRGEFMDLLQVPASDVRVFGTGGPNDLWATLINARPVGTSRGLTADEAAVTTVWKANGLQGQLALTETTVLRADSGSFELIEQATAEQPFGGIELQLRPLRLAAASNITSDGLRADLYFPQTGLEEPHLRIDVVGGNGLIALGDDGRLTVRSATDRVHLRVTALTAGEGTSSLQILDPAQLINAYDVAAVLLVRHDPAFLAREQRMEDLGYRLGLSAGAYALMVRN